MRVDSLGWWLVDVSLSGPGCKDRAMWLWNSCVEERRGSWVKLCLELGRNEKVLITTVMPACQSAAGLSRPWDKVTAKWSDDRWSCRSNAAPQNTQLPTSWSVMKAVQELISHWGLKTNHFTQKKEKKEEKKLICLDIIKAKSQVTAGCQSWLFLTVREHKSGLMYITNPTTLHKLNLFF